RKTMAAVWDVDRFGLRLITATVHIDRDLRLWRHSQRDVPHRAAVCRYPDIPFGVLRERIYLTARERVCFARVDGRDHLASGKRKFLDLTFVGACPERAVAIYKHRRGRVAVKRGKREAVVCAVVGLDASVRRYKKSIAESRDPSHVVIGQPALDVDQLTKFGRRIKPNRAPTR